jgi:hypothetical protein
LNYVLQPPGSVNLDSSVTDFPFADSVIPYTFQCSPLIKSGEGILKSNRHLRHLGLIILFKHHAYAPVCLCIRWFHQLRFVDLYKQVKSQTCWIKRQVYPSQGDRVSNSPIFGISYWTRLVFPINIFWPQINRDLRSISHIFEQMVSLQSLHLILVFLPDQAQVPDWNILLRVLSELPLRRVSFTIHRFLRRHEQLLMSIPSLAIPNGPLYRPTTNSGYFSFEAANLPKEAGLSDFHKLLCHTTGISLRSSFPDSLQEG